MMHDKTLSRSGIRVSSYCLGTMYFGTKISERDALRQLDTYADSGGNFLDCANKYASWVPGFSGGESERVVGKWLKGRRREEYVLTSKVGFAYGRIPKSLSREIIISECEKSLERLGTDHIDLYFAHTQDEQTPVEESMEAFDRLVRSGKVRSIGASNHDVLRLSESNRAARRLQTEPFTVLQQRYSLLQPYVGADFGTQRILTPEQEAYCRSAGMTLMAYSPLLGGVYSQASPALPVQYDNAHNRKILDLIRRYATESGYAPVQLVLAGISEERDIIPIVAAGSVAHLKESLTMPDREVVKRMMEEIALLDSFHVSY